MDFIFATYNRLEINSIFFDYYFLLYYFDFYYVGNSFCNKTVTTK